ncbi:hypothetical protein FB476_2251 [Ornithinimicrobium humiphilum]|uniref:Uncharacterized protein n=1 Tax=Ornithinimicrobium humiphilum TaxID=125288 RepID=A0A543KQI2_9MICO|nr:hypothetical protein FB476_2251 [Ornithinimicrobium humiphilum]
MAAVTDDRSAATEAAVRTERHGPAMWLRLQRPEPLNGIYPEMS